LDSLATALGRAKEAYVLTREPIGADTEATKVLRPIGDPALVLYLARSSRERIRQHMQEPGSSGRCIHCEKWDGAWLACLDRFSEMGRSGDNAAFDYLVGLLDGRDIHDGGLFFLGLAISEGGKAALPALQRYRGKEEWVARDIIKTIEEGRIYW
jgi:hypothetical protein